MSIPDSLISLHGSWDGNNRLHLPWLPTPTLDSSGTAEVSPRIAGQFLEIAYTWSYEGEAHEGLLILSGDKKTDAVSAFWSDSWHMAHKVMICEGSVKDDGRIDLKGHYKVPDHPDWGWRTELIPNADSLIYNMYNVSPENEESIAVEMKLKRI
jgi:hypothetical protein